MHRQSIPFSVRPLHQSQSGQSIKLILLTLAFLAFPAILLIESLLDDNQSTVNPVNSPDTTEYVTYNVKGMVDGAMNINDKGCVKQSIENPKSFILSSSCIDKKVPKDSVVTKIVLNVMSTTEKTVQQMLDSVRSTASLFNRCGIAIGDVELNYFYDNGRYRQITRKKQFELLKGYRINRNPALFFTHSKHKSWKDDFIGNATIGNIMDYSASGFEYYFGAEATPENRTLMMNSALLLTDYYNSWTINQHIRDAYLGTVIAHELFHIYGNCYCHEEDDRNFMHKGTYNVNPAITQSQCERLQSGIKRMNQNQLPIHATSEVQY